MKPLSSGFSPLQNIGFWGYKMLNKDRWQWQNGLFTLMGFSFPVPVVPSVAGTKAGTCSSPKRI
jgi:hypothetical protein